MKQTKVHHLIPLFSAKFRHLSPGSVFCVILRDDVMYKIGDAVTVGETNWKIRGLTGNSMTGVIFDLVLESIALEHGYVILGIKIDG